MKIKSRNSRLTRRKGKLPHAYIPVLAACAVACTTVAACASVIPPAKPVISDGDKPAKPFAYADGDNDWEAYAYADFVARGGVVVDLPYRSTQSPPFGLRDVVKLDMLNKTSKPICAAVSLNYDDGVLRIPGSALIDRDKKNWFSLESDSDVEQRRRAAVIGGYALDESMTAIEDLYHFFGATWDQVTIEINAGDQQEFILDPVPFWAHVPPAGDYEVFFHIFAPYCKAIQGKELSYSVAYALHGLLSTDRFNALKEKGYLPPINERKLEFERLEDGDDVTIENTAGILFKVRIPIRIREEE